MRMLQQLGTFGRTHVQLGIVDSLAIPVLYVLSIYLSGVLLLNHAHTCVQYIAGDKTTHAIYIVHEDILLHQVCSLMRVYAHCPHVC